MKPSLLILFSLILFLGQLHAFLPYEEGGREAWESSMRHGFLKLKAKPVPEQITYLSDLVYSLNGTYRSVEVAPIRMEATNLLIAIPGHAEFYQDKIEAMRAEVLANAKKTDDELFEMHAEGQEVVNEWSYSSYCGTTAFPILAQMPSPETVAVLGHFLNDPEGRNGKNITGRAVVLSDGASLTINAEAGAKAIRNLGIEHPPFKAPAGREREGLSEGEVDAWKDWWNEVKSGKRTYRFIGSPIEYGPDGPASNDVIKRAQQNMKRDEERSAGRRKVSAGSKAESSITQINKPSSIAGILAACALVAGAVWYFLRGRKTV